jgi:hypothetical protein
MPNIKIDDEWLFNSNSYVKINKDSSVRLLIKNISSHCYDNIKLDKAFNIEGWLEKLLECEVYLSFTKKRHRDHLLHACRIAVLGDVILNFEITKGKNKFILLDLVRELIKENSVFIQMFKKYDLNISAMTNKELNGWIIQIWYIAALFHDIGFVYEAFLESFYNIRFLTKYPNFQEFYMEVESDILQFQKNFSISHSHDVCTSCEFGRKFDHGKIGACLVYNLLGETTSISETAAIVTDCHTSNEKIDFSKDPLSFLLILLDEIQEWERPVIGKKLRDQALAEKIGSRYKDYSFLGPELKYINMNYSINNALNLKFNLDYEENFKTLDDSNFIFPMMLYLKYKNLQRLDVGYESEAMKKALKKLKIRDLTDFNIDLQFTSKGILADKWHQQCDSLLFLSELDKHRSISNWLINDTKYRTKKGIINFTINKKQKLKRIEGDFKAVIEESNDRYLRDNYISDEYWTLNCIYEKLGDPGKVKFSYYIKREISSNNKEIPVNGIYAKFDDKPICYTLEEIKVDGLSIKEKVGFINIPGIENTETSDSMDEDYVIYIPFEPPLSPSNKKIVELKLSMELSLEKEKFQLRPRIDGVYNTRNTRKLSGAVTIKWEKDLFDNLFEYGAVFKGAIQDILELEEKIKITNEQKAIVKLEACTEWLKKQERDGYYEFKMDFKDLEHKSGAGIAWVPLLSAYQAV